MCLCGLHQIRGVAFAVLLVSVMPVLQLCAFVWKRIRALLVSYSLRLFAWLTAQRIVSISIWFQTTFASIGIDAPERCRQDQNSPDIG